MLLPSHERFEAKYGVHETLVADDIEWELYEEAVETSPGIYENRLALRVVSLKPGGVADNALVRGMKITRKAGGVADNALVQRVDLYFKFKCALS